jgi:hypothetical protein
MLPVHETEVIPVVSYDEGVDVVNDTCEAKNPY